MADSSILKPFILSFEGGYSNKKSDRGGATMKGVTLETFRKVYGASKTASDLKKITDVQWHHIFKKYYWDACNADEIENQSVANLIVDHYFNSGKRMFVKQVLKDRFGAKIKVDSKISRDTIAIINASNPEFLHFELKKSREKYYRSLGGVNLRGWLNRLSRFVFEKKKPKPNNNATTIVKPSYSHAWDWLVFTNKKAFQK